VKWDRFDRTAEVKPKAEYWNILYQGKKMALQGREEAAPLLRPDIEGKISMALQGPDGETHSHLSAEDRRASVASDHLDVGRRLSRLASDEQAVNVSMEPRVTLPDRGTWVGPHPGETHEQRASAAKEWGDRMDREFVERQQRLQEMRDAPSFKIPRPVHHTESLEKRIDQLEKSIMKLQSAMIALQSERIK